MGVIAGVGVWCLCFIKGTVRVPLHRFLAVTIGILMLVAFQLGLTGLHELSESQWLPSSKTEMAIIGPVVRNELFFFVLIFGAAALLVLREWQTVSHSKGGKPGEPKPAINEAERRLLDSQNRRQRNWMMAAATACLLVILVLTADFIYARATSAPPSRAAARSRRGGARRSVAPCGRRNRPAGAPAAWKSPRRRGGGRR